MRCDRTPAELLTSGRKYPYGELLAGIGQRFELHVIGDDVFAERLVLVMLPVWEIEVLVKYDHGARADAIRQEIENVLGAAVEITVDMHEGETARVAGLRSRNGVCEPCLVLG